MSQTQPLPHDSPGAPTHWSAKPVIYEVNAWVWLNELSRKHGRRISLANLPERELDELASWRFEAVWLMGVWRRGAATRKSALNYLHEYRHALPDISEADVAGSAYAIHDYQVESRLGGREGLAAFRDALRQRGLKLILDFVPNHVATDHRWIAERPEFFIQGAPADLESQPGDFFAATSIQGEKLVIARGRDPYFPAWIDTAQLNAFHAGLRRALIDTLIDIGAQCDGLRCDMAMLATNQIFAQTWKGKIDAAPALDFWREILPAVRAARPQLLFIAEVYWDLEHELQLQGFDYTYDKRMYDRLVNADGAGIRSHLRADGSYTRSNIRFIENHDEPRAREALGEDRQRAAAALICTLPGAALLHQGQLRGRRIKLPVQVVRAPVEAADPMLERFYRRLLREISQPLYLTGRWRMLEPRAIHATESAHENLIAYAWTKADHWRLVVINLGSEWSRAAIDPGDCPPATDGPWLLYDILSESFTRHCGAALRRDGLQLETPPCCARIFRLTPDPGRSHE